MKSLSTLHVNAFGLDTECEDAHKLMNFKGSATYFAVIVYEVAFIRPETNYLTVITVSL